MNPQSEAFQMGKQVAIIRPYMGLGVGCVGTITRIYPTHPPSYRIRFAQIDLTVPIPRAYLAMVRSSGRM
jgi:hypothetical protein